MRRFLLATALLLPMATHAQVVARYRYTLIFPTGSVVMDPKANPVVSKTTLDGKYTSVVTLSVSDTAGMKLWRVAVDSSLSSRQIHDTATVVHMETLLADRAPPRPNGDATRMGPVTHQILMPGKIPVHWTQISMSLVGAELRRTETSIDSLRGNADLSHQFAGLGLLVPNATLPTTVGGSRTDTVAAHIVHPPWPWGAFTVNPPERFDTTITVWRRTAASRIEATATSNITSVSPTSTSKEVGMAKYLINFDSDDLIHDVTVTATSNSVTTSSNADRAPRVNASERSYTLTRISK